VPPANA
jgi:GTP-binding protein SAR1